MADIFETRTVLDTLRDRAYDTVFHVGDTASQFLWDVIAGPSETRHQGYRARQDAMANRKAKRRSPYPEQTDGPAVSIKTEQGSVRTEKKPERAKKQTNARKRRR